MSNTYNISEVAGKLGLSTKTLRRWEEAGKFRGGRTEGNQRRYTLGDIHVLDAIKAGLVGSHKELMTKEQVKEQFGVDSITLDEWENKGKILPLVTADGIFYPQKSVISQLKSHLIAKPPSLSPLTFSPATPMPLAQTLTHPAPTSPFTPTALTPTTMPTHNLTHHDFWVLFLLNVLVTLVLVLLYHILTHVYS